MKALVINSYALVLAVCIALLAAEFVSSIYGTIGHELMKFMPR